MSDALLDAIFDFAPVGLLVIEPRTGMILNANAKSHELFGYQPNGLLALALSDAIGPRDTEKLLQLRGRQARHRPLMEWDTDISRRGGESIACRALATIIGGQSLVDEFVLAIFNPVEDERRLGKALQETRDLLDQANARLQTMATVDSVTLMLNRRGLEIAINTEIEGARREGTSVMSIIVDLDDFDSLNNRFGYPVGDAVLREVGICLEHTVRVSDYVGRIGRDQFLILLPDTELSEALLVAENVRLRVAGAPLIIASETLAVTATLGVVPLSPKMSSFEEVLSLARMALRTAKSAGPNNVTVCDYHGHVPHTNHQPVGADFLLQASLNLRSVSQPIYDLQNEQCVAYEMLARGPVGPLESPMDLFRFSRNENLLTLMDLRCLTTCLSGSRLLSREKRYHVNLFPSTLIDTPTDHLMQIFDDAECDPASFCVELSEQQFIGDPKLMRSHVSALRNKGVQIAPDDVGFGRSSVEALIMLEPDIVKIDKRYVNGVAADADKQRSLERLVRIIDALGAETIAEGIESIDDLKFTREIGVKYGQGFLWGQPA